MLDISKTWVVQFVILLVIIALNPANSAKIAWDKGDDLAQWYEIRARSLDLEPQVITGVTRVTSLEAVPVRPRSGHWAYEVRACRVYESKDQCSTWVKSDVDGKPEPWAVLWKPPPVTNIVIEDEGAN